MKRCLLLAALVACGGAEPAAVSAPRVVSGGGAPDAAPPGPAGDAAPRAPVVVAIVVDQLSAWVAEERLPLLPGDGGFAQLRREGTWAKALRLPYASTDTAPGHASLHTGRTPAESGIWGNELPEPSGRRVTFLRDAATKLVVPDGVLASPGSSAARLRVETVADRLRRAHPDALVVSVSLKDRGAIMPAGKQPSVAIWFESALGTFATSTAFASSFPQWAEPLAGPRAIERARAAPWTPSDPAWLARHAGEGDAGPGEGDLDGLGTVFPHVARTNAAFRAMPATDALLFELALAAASAEHDPKKPTLLLLSLSASDVIGHVFGPDSWEAWDHLYKLDAALGRFLAALERRVGDVSVVLSADHGNSSMPEVVRARRPPACDGPAPPVDPYERPACTSGVRITPHELQRELKAEADKALGTRAPWILGVAAPYVFLTEEGRALPEPKRATLDAAIRRVFARRKGAVAEIHDVRTLARTCPETLARARGVPDRARPGEDILTLVCRSWSPGSGAGDFYMVPRSGSYFDGELVAGKGASHGGPYLHDRTVPLLVRAPGAVDAGAVIADPVDFTAYSRILGALLGLDAEPPRVVLASLRAR
ncbi:MAG: alkaline phosphatase family protein [Labilithrix sp.]|nr:alkaline phosphatase family protein [Labilithrix sp.]